jgi:hypothetical protein
MSDERVKDLLCCGLESGPYGDFVIVGYEPKGAKDTVTYPHLDLPFIEGAAVLLRDKYGDSDKVYRLDRAALQRGLDVMAKESPYQTSEFLNENEDVITGTVFVQCALLGEIVYG